MDGFSILILKACDDDLEFSLLDGRSMNPLKSGVRGKVKNIGALSSLNWAYGSADAQVLIQARNHEEATEWVLDWLHNLWPFGSLIDELSLVVHQFEDGGIYPYAPIIVTEKIMTKLDDISPFATANNFKAIAVLRKSKKIISKKVSTMAIFDTNISHHFRPLGYI